MKKLNTILVLLLTVVISTTCKKYDEGGFVRQTRLHLFGGHHVGDSKTWKLKLYEVNGIDSTYLIQGANTIPDFYTKHVTFKLTEPKTVDFTSDSFLYHYRNEVDEAYKKVSFASDLSHVDTVQCNLINNQTYCARSIFSPENNNHTALWDLKKLTKKELILEIKLINSYKIVLTH